jgi:hypothetical protein
MWDHVRSVLVWLAHHRPSAAGLAAVAAFFSAFSSFLIMRIQRSNLIESVRPELVLIGWSRKPPGGPGAHDTVSFMAIKNVGRGTAFNIWLHASHEESGNPTAVMSTKRLPLLAVDEQITLNVDDGRILVWFKNTERSTISVVVHVSSWDSRGNEYETRYDLVVFDSSHTLMSDSIAPGVFASRTTTMRPAWRVKMRARVLQPWYAVVNLAVRLKLKLKKG